MEESNTGNGAESLDQHPLALLKGTTVFSSIVLLGILGAVASFGVVSSIVVTARDGYRRMPKESFARTV